MGCWRRGAGTVGFVSDVGHLDRAVRHRDKPEIAGGTRTRARSVAIRRRHDGGIAHMTGTPFERIWDKHVIKDYGDGRALIHIDRHFAHEGTSARAFDGLRRRGLKVRRPDLTLGTIDHGISTAPGRTLTSWAANAPRNLAMQKNCAEFGVRLFDVEDPNHGIVHIAGAYLGFALPGCTYVCGDSHTATCGGVGAWAWGIGTTEVMQVLAAQALVMRKPRTLRAEFNGTPSRGIYAKDMILALIGR